MPGVQCVVAFCKSNALLKKKDGKRISFHKFPKDEQLRKRWIKFCRREKPFNPDSACICSKHFTKRDYENSDVECSIKKELNIQVKKRLKNTAYPSILQIKVDNTEQVEIMYEPPEKIVKDDSLDSSIKNDGYLDLQIVSRRDLEHLKESYLALMEEHEVLQKTNIELQELIKIQDGKIENLSKELLASN